MQNFEAVTGDNFNLNLTFEDSAGDPINISAWESIKLTIKSRKALLDADAEYQGNATVTSGVGGLATVALTPADTEELVGSYYYDVQYVDGDGTVKTFMSGIITFTRDITIAGAL